MKGVKRQSRWFLLLTCLSRLENSNVMLNRSSHGRVLIILMDVCRFALGLYTSCSLLPQATGNRRRMLFFNHLGVLRALLSNLACFGDEPNSSLLTESTQERFGLSLLVVLIGSDRDKIKDNGTLSSAINTYTSCT